MVVGRMRVGPWCGARRRWGPVATTELGHSGAAQQGWAHAGRGPDRGNKRGGVIGGAWATVPQFESKSN
jgi:hypothetical protein